jgi:DNA-binding LacI/PurR family transcriptional regulator
VPYDYAAVKLIIDEVFTRRKPPEAVMCFSDFIAIHVYQALKERLLRIPEDVAVMGFCGYPGGRFLEPALSTIDLGYENIGKMAAELMLNAENWHKCNANPLSICTPYRLVQRQSTTRNKGKIRRGKWKA